MDESKEDCGSFVVLNIKLNGENLEYTFLRPFDFVVNLNNAVHFGGITGFMPFSSANSTILSELQPSSASR